MQDYVMKTILFLFLCLIISPVFAQKQSDSRFQISGSLVDSVTQDPLPYATLSVFPAGSKQPVDGTVTDPEGHFTVENLAPGNYTVLAEFIGYAPQTVLNVILDKNHPVANLKQIRLRSRVKTLQNITISVQPKIVENKIDKMVFNADRDITSQVGVATDVLKKVPQVSVDIDGNVELAGSSSVRFLINGKPSAAFGSDIADVLQAIPASQIKSIEVITNPGAKYDAEGIGGIINIILKENNSRGVNGNLSLTAGTRTENGSFNFNLRQGNFGLNAFVSGNTRLKTNSYSNSLRVTDDTTSNEKIFLNQDNSGDDQRSGYQTGLGFDWDLNKYNSLTGNVSYRNFGHKSTAVNSQLQDAKDVSGNLLSEISNSINSDHRFDFKNVDASLNYKKTFKKEDQELDVSLSTSLGNRTVKDNIYQFALPQDSLYYSTLANNPGTENNSQLRVDYAQPVGKSMKFGMGGKINYYDVNSNSTVLKLNANNDYSKDNYLSNSLDYHQKVYALYAELAFPVFNWFDAKLGERYERTEINSYFSNAQQQEDVPGYNTFVPSLFFSKKVSDRSMFKFSYSKRIRRPDYRSLNPFINTSDPKNLSTGNINLKPETGNRYELGFSTDIGSGGIFMANIFYRENNGDIQPFIVYYPSYQVGDTVYNNVALSMPENVGRQQSYGLNLFTSAKFFSKLDLRSNVFLYQRHTTNNLEKGFDYSSFNYHLNLNADYQFSNTVVAEFFGNFRSARHEAQGTYPSWTSYSFAIRKQIWNKKGSIALTASNFFRKNLIQRTQLNGTNFVINSVRTIPFRSIGINFTWKFGKLEFKKDKDSFNNNGGSDNT